MKTSLVYGIGMALAGFLLGLILFLAGFHSDPAKLQVAQWAGVIGGSAIGIITLVLGLKARREEIPPSEPFTYGRALGTGTMIALFGALFGSLLNLVYFSFINPNFTEVVVAASVARMEAQGVPYSQIEQAEGMVRTMSGPIPQTIFGFLSGFFFEFVYALIVAAFLKRPATGETPPPVG